MNERQKHLCVQLAKMGSEQAAEWLMTKYPIESIDYGEALLLIPHRSWKPSDQKRLTRYYFRKMPFSGAGGYEAFASLMSIRNFLDCVKERLPMSASDASLLLYYLIPVLNKTAKSGSDRQLIMSLINEIQLHERAEPT
ncbi:hypothetical protein DZC75_07100 [Pseudomonas parafulva]|uniref:Uncharacterized protein n=1 Tax=Pseudomonas parafulva TaxID=157782 RepID=A0AAI8K9H7_9PSED|nr:hypothetical protein [Pseudomonas parafulva]AXO87790.1 hypothetical protein DZC75_07100 [Pseudomonas parafulva]